MNDVPVRDAVALTLASVIQAAGLVALLGVRQLWLREEDEPARCFGVPHARVNAADAERTLAGFRIQLVVHAVIATVFAIHWLNPLLGVAWLLVGAAGAVIWARRRARAFAVAPTQLDPTSRRAALIGSGSPVRSALAQAGPLLLLAVFSVPLFARFQDLPTLIPVHYGLSGHADHSVPKTLLSVGLLPFVALLMVLYMRFAGWLLARETRRELSASGRTHRRATFDTLRIVEYSIVMVFGTLAWLPLFAPTARQVIVLVAVVCAGPLTMAVVASRLASASGTSGAGTPSFGEQEARREKHWRAGVIYVNPDDPALMVPKLIGVGYTLNYGHARAWWMLSLLLLGPILIAGVAVVFVLSNRA